ncbi:MAG: hypothetical protein AB1776_07415 [Bacillota bacterium]
MNATGDRRYLFLGIASLAVFAVVLIVFFLPLFGGRTGMQAADDLFNSLSKGSSYYIPAVARDAEMYRGREVSWKVKVEDEELGAAIARVFAAAGATAGTEAGKVTVSGDMGRLAVAAAADADALYKNETAGFEPKYGLDGRRAVYCWYKGFEALEKAARAEGKTDVANFAKKVMTKALEPAFNFAGIPAASFSERLGVALFLLVFYVVYTVWYGFGVMFIFEGLGISASKSH